MKRKIYVVLSVVLFALLLTSCATVDAKLIGSSVANAVHPKTLLMVLLGCIGGILIGSIPGLTSTMGIALLVPFTYGMEIVPAVGMLMGIFCGGMYGGSISAILIHTPGTPAAAATILDGYPMGQKGQAGRALSIALMASFIGGLLSALIMTFLSPTVSRMALKFSSAEFFTLAVFGLSVIVSISGKSILKGLITAVFGLLISCVGMDKVCAYLRFTKARFLYDGIPFIPCLIGLFALSEVFASIEKSVKSESVEAKINRVLPDKNDMKTIMPTSVIGGTIGSFIGAIPGAGGDIAAFVSYSVAKSMSRHPQDFGKGVPEGVAAAESANNGCTGGAMIPMLSLGVPGDSNTAVLMGAFVMQGFTPGPMMYVEHLDVVYSVFAALIIANFVMLIAGMCGIRGFAKIISVDKKKLLPAILVLSLVGAYAINRNVADVFFSIAMGVVGYLFQKYEFPLSPVLLALILGPMAESYLRRYMQIVDGSFMTIFKRPISVVFIVLAVVSIVISLMIHKKSDDK